jgi:hypothetical protein
MREWLAGIVIALSGAGSAAADPAFRYETLPDGSSPPQIGDLWEFACPAGGAATIFLDTVGDTKGMARIDFGLSVRDGKGNLLDREITEEGCRVPTACGALCPRAGLTCGDGASHTVAVFDVPPEDPTAIDPCTGGPTGSRSR